MTLSKKMMDEEHERLRSAIRSCVCPYCLAEPGEPCVTVQGENPGIHHSGLLHGSRVHEGHIKLVKEGRPIRTSESIVRRGRNHLCPISKK